MIDSWVYCTLLHKGAFNNYVDKSCHFLTPPPPPNAWTVFIPWAWTNTDIFDPLSPSSCPRSYWMPPKRSKQRNFYSWEKNVFLFHLKNIIYLHFCLNEKLSCPGSLQKKTTAGLFLMWNLQVCSGTKFPYKVLALVLFVPMINNKETMMEQQKGVWFIMIRCCWVQINSSTKRAN